jgi:hypothetical protein
MNRKKLRKLRQEIARMRRAPQKAQPLESLAQALGRKLANRGKEPVWVSTEFDDLYPVSIPRHGARIVSIGTKNSILDQLEDDVQAWDMSLEDEEGSDDDTNEESGE